MAGNWLDGADGGQHFESQTDKVRDAYLQSKGFRVLRLWNTDILANREGVQRMIMEALARCAPGGAAPSPSCALGLFRPEGHFVR